MTKTQNRAKVTVKKKKKGGSKNHVARQVKEAKQASKERQTKLTASEKEVEKEEDKPFPFHEDEPSEHVNTLDDLVEEDFFDDIGDDDKEY